MNPRLLYFEGDRCAPKYVAGALREAGVPFTVVHDGSEVPERPESHDAFILSDFAADTVEAWVWEGIERAVREDGAGLLMVGGWKSFGAGGFAATPIAAALPVFVEDLDDRVNWPAGMYVEAVGRSALAEALPLDLPVVIAGLNRVISRPEADTPLVARHVINRDGPLLELSEDWDPFVSLWRHGRGRAAAITTDLAPHWSGGLTDWGPERIDVGHGEEIGDGYVALDAALVRAIAPALPLAPSPR